MLFKLSTAVVVVLLSSLSSTLASTALPNTILVPCGSATTGQHAIVPDATCQQISSSGAFAIAVLGKFERGVKLGFSASPDCKATYTPTVEELGQLQQNQTCRTFVTGAGSDVGAVKEGLESKAKTDGTTNEKQQPQPQDGLMDKPQDKPHGKPQDGSKDSHNDDKSQPQDASGANPDKADAGKPGGAPAAQVGSKGIIKKRASTDDKKGPANDEVVRESTGSAVLLAGQTPLRYVMLVNA